MNYTEPRSPLDVLKFFGDSLFGEENLWTDAHFILADVPLDAERAKKILPRGLRLEEPATATLFIVDYRQNSFTVPYHEAALLMHVRSPLGRGLHCPWMIVDDDTALIHGRELLGFPKKMGVFTFEEDERHVKASISRRGVTVLEMEGERGRFEDSPEPVLARKIFNTGGPGQFYLMNPMWVFHPTEVIHETYESNVKVTAREAEFDPISELIAGDATSGRIAIIDIPSGKYIMPAGFGGLLHFGRTFPMRFR